MPYKDIGMNFGKRDHSTVIHACNKISKDVISNEDIKKKVEEIKRTLFL